MSRLLAGMTSIAILGIIACGPREPQTITPPPATEPPRTIPSASASTTIPAPSAPASAAASASATASPPLPDAPPRALPPGFVDLPEKADVRCGSFRVQVLPEGPPFPRFVRVLAADGTTAYEAHGRTYKQDANTTDQADLAGEFCGDLTGDGVPEIVLTESTMGAHCCYTRYVVSLTSPPKRLLMWQKGDAGTEILPVKLRQGKSYQLVDRLVLWPPFDPDKGDPVLSYASAPLVPVVFSFTRAGRFELTSLSFPEAFRQNRNAMRALCARAPDDCFTEIIEWIDSLALGDWDREKTSIKDLELRAALDRNTPAMKKVIAAQLGSEARPGKTEPSP